MGRWSVEVLERWLCEPSGDLSTKVLLCGRRSKLYADLPREAEAFYAAFSSNSTNQSGGRIGLP